MNRRRSAPLATVFYTGNRWPFATQSKRAASDLGNAGGAAHHHYFVHILLGNLGISEHLYTASTTTSSRLASDWRPRCTKCPHNTCATGRKQF